MIGGERRWVSGEPPGKSSGRLRQKLLPACTSLTPSSTFCDVMRLIRPSSSSSPQSPHVEPSDRRTHRFDTADLPTTLYCPVRTTLTVPRGSAPPRLARFGGGERVYRPPFILMEGCHRTQAGGCGAPATSGRREDGPLGGDHAGSLAPDEVGLVDTAP